jgi:HEAT repeat protein
MGKLVRKGDQLIRKILADPIVADADGRWPDQLLMEIRKGFPCKNLRLLLASPSGDAVKIGAWIASELGPSGAELVQAVARRLQHPLKAVRLYVLDCIYLWATPENGREIAGALRLLEDDDKGVRWKAMDSLLYASPEQLAAALEYLERTDPSSPQVAGLWWLVDLTEPDVAEQIAAQLNSDEVVVRKYAAVAAAQASETAPQLLEQALASDDADIVEFATSILAQGEEGDPDEFLA